MNEMASSDAGDCMAGPQSGDLVGKCFSKELQRSSFYARCRVESVRLVVDWVWKLLSNLNVTTHRGSHHRFSMRARETVWHCFGLLSSLRSSDEAVKQHLALTSVS